jgi:hypothetical protein
MPTTEPNSAPTMASTEATTFTWREVAPTSRSAA